MRSRKTGDIRGEGNLMNVDISESSYLQGISKGPDASLLSTDIEWHLSLCIVRRTENERPTFAAELQPHQYVLPKGDVTQLT
jgi:hypothetical protein